MKKNRSKTEYNVLPFESEPALTEELIGMGVTEEEVLAADRLLKSVADDENSRVDYAGMLRNIKAEAMKQGLAASVNAGKAKKSRAKRAIGIAVSAAAAFVLSLGVIGVVGAMAGRSSGDKAAPSQGDVVAYASEAPAATEVELKGSPSATAPNVPAATSEPVQTEVAPVRTTDDANEYVEFTPLPTEVAVRGGVRGYTYITGFTAPEKSEELYEGLLPEGMTAIPLEEGIGFIAKAEADENGFRFICCRLEDAVDSDLEPGVAVYTIKTLGGIDFVWRIDEHKLMYIEFEGFEYSEAEQFLFSYSAREAEQTPAR